MLNMATVASMTKGCLKYIPKEAVTELSDIKTNFGILKDADAFHKMAEFSSMGRNLFNNLGYSFHKDLKEINLNIQIRKKK